MMGLGVLAPRLKDCFRKHPEILAVYAFGSVVKGKDRLGVVHEILRTGKRVYEKPGRKFRREEAQLLSEALDFLPIKETIEKKAIERIKAFRG